LIIEIPAGCVALTLQTHVHVSNIALLAILAAVFSFSHFLRFNSGILLSNRAHMFPIASFRCHPAL